MGSFDPQYKCMTLNFIAELFVMSMKNDANVEDKLTCRLKIETSI